MKGEGSDLGDCDQEQVLCRGRIVNRLLKGTRHVVLPGCRPRQEVSLRTCWVAKALMDGRALLKFESKRVEHSDQGFLTLAPLRVSEAGERP